MKRFLLILSPLLALSWAVSLFVFKAGAVCHTFLFLAVLAILQGVMITATAASERSR
ncbi:MAG: hypothetical protein ACK4E0_06165 [Chitinophagaceae bacterium]